MTSLSAMSTHGRRGRRDDPDSILRPAHHRARATDGAFDEGCGSVSRAAEVSSARASRRPAGDITAVVHEGVSTRPGTRAGRVTVTSTSRGMCGRGVHEGTP